MQREFRKVLQVQYLITISNVIKQTLKQHVLYIDSYLSVNWMWVRQQLYDKVPQLVKN
jgi:hypothetical protein